jgi:hypothetical protein
MSNFCDAVSGANLYGGSSYSFTSDRFGNSNSAILLSNGYLQVPSGIYFTGSYFTITAWVKLYAHNSYAQIFDFGNGKDNNNVMFGYTTNGGLRLAVLSGSAFSSISNSISSLNTWYHVAAVLSGTTGYVYINGVQVATGTVNAPNNISRTSNFIGRDNWPDDSYAYAAYDELKIYNTALSAYNVNLDMSIGANNSKILQNFPIKSNLYN